MSPSPDRSRSRSPMQRSLTPKSRSRSQSPRRSRSATPIRRRSLTPVRRSRSRSRGAASGGGGGGGSWQRKLDRLIDDGIIRAGEIDSRTMDSLEGLSTDLAECAMERFAEANFQRINNKSGFLMGIIRRMEEDGPDRGGANMESLNRSVRHRLRDLIDEGKLSNEDVDQRMIKTLADLNTELGLEAIEKFASSNLETVRSKTGFMMGIIRRVDMESRGGGGPPPYGGQAPYRGAPYGGGPPPYGGGYGGGYGGPPPPYGGGGGYGGDRGGYGGDRGGGYGDRGGGYGDRDSYRDRGSYNDRYSDRGGGGGGGYSDRGGERSSYRSSDRDRY